MTILSHNIDTLTEQDMRAALINGVKPEEVIKGDVGLHLGKSLLWIALFIACGIAILMLNEDGKFAVIAVACLFVAIGGFFTLSSRSPTPAEIALRRERIAAVCQQLTLDAQHVYARPAVSAGMTS